MLNEVKHLAGRNLNAGLPASSRPDASLRSA